MSEQPVYSNPAAAPAAIGMYSHLSRVGDLLFVAGQVGLDADGELVGPSVAEQMPQVFANIATLLEAEGGSLRNVAKFTTYLCDADDIRVFYEVREELFPRLFGGEEYPPNTLLVIDRLVRPELRIEVEAVAGLG